MSNLYDFGISICIAGGVFSVLSVLFLVVLKLKLEKN